MSDKKKPHRSETEEEISSEKKDSAKRRAWESHKFRTNLLFAALVILIYFLITNLPLMGKTVTTFLSLFTPLLTGVLLALILNIPLAAIERFLGMLNRKSKAKRKMSPKVISTVSLVLTFILALLLLYFVGNSVVPQIVSSFKSIVESVETYYPKALAYLESWGFDTSDLNKLLSQLDLNAIWKSLTENAGAILDTALNTALGAFSALTNLVTAVIFSIYILANRQNLKRQSNKLLLAYCKPATGSKIKFVGKLVIQTFSNFFSGQCLEAVILGIIFFIAMTVGGFPYAVVISVIIAVTALIPYVGAFIGCAIGAILIFMHSPMRALIFIVMFLVIQQLENHLIYPRVVGTSVGLPAIWTFAALIAGGALFGVAGMILFIPAASVLYSLLRSDVNQRIHKKFGDAVPETPETAASAALSSPEETPRLPEGAETTSDETLPH